MVRVLEYDIKLYLYQDIAFEEIGYRLGQLLNQVLCKDEKWVERHYDKSYKSLTFNYLYPMERDRLYKAGKIYNFQCRTLDSLVELILDQELHHFWNKDFKIIIVKKKTLSFNRIIERVYTTTPLIIKTDQGYWKGELDFDAFEERLRGNLIKKYNQLTGESIRQAPIFTSIRMDNRKPIAVSYKGIRLLGDKVTLYLSPDDLSQKIIQVGLAMGLGENNASLGAGFLNFKYEEMSG